MKYCREHIVWSGKVASLLTTGLLMGLGTVTLADEKLEEQFREYLGQETLKTALSLKRLDFARTLSETECAYQSEVADITLDALSQGMTIEEIKASSETAGMPTMVEDFLGRQEEPAKADASTRAKYVLEVAEACQNASEILIQEGA